MVQYHKQCASSNTSKTSFNVHQTSQYVRSYKKSDPTCIILLNRGIGCVRSNPHVNQNFRLPKSKIYGKRI